MLRLLLSAFFLLVICSGYAQLRNLPLNKQACRSVEKELNALEDCFHSSFKPYIGSSLPQKRGNQVDTNSIKRSWLFRKLRKENLIFIDSAGQHLTVDPILNLQYGVDLFDHQNGNGLIPLYRNGRGFRVEGDLGDGVSFSSTFFENQAFFPSYIDQFIQLYGIVPGQGKTKPYKETGYDFAFASGYVSFQPIKKLNIQLGHGNHFIGDGYRSLMLSDNSFNYPYLRISTNIWKIQYTNLYTVFQNLNVELPTSSVTQRRFQRKAGSIHHLSFALNNHIQLGIFEGVIWRSADENNSWETSDYLSFANPIIFVRPIQYGLNGTINVITGANCNAKLGNGIFAYAQAVLDDHKTNRFGYQAGVKWFDAFSLNNLFVQGEYNHAEPFTYGHADSTRNFSHYNQALAHPLGAGFDEIISCVYFSYKDLFVEGRIQFAKYDDDSLMVYHYGKDIFKPYNTEYEEPRTPDNTVLLNRSIKLGYIVNRKTNLQIFAGYTNRIEKTVNWKTQMDYFYLGLSSILDNTYYDF